MSVYRIEYICDKCGKSPMKAITKDANGILYACDDAACEGKATLLQEYPRTEVVAKDGTA